VIADYPKSIFTVGEVIKTQRGLIYCDEQGPKYSDYPHLFELVGWWEAVEEKDLPQYVKLASGEIRRFKSLHGTHSVALYDHPGEIEYDERVYAQMDGQGYELYPLEGSTPATEDEYYQPQR
jgi:hypothetical protein